MVHRIAACLVGGGLLFSQASTTKAQVTFSLGNSPAGPRVTVGQPYGSGYGYGNPYYGQPGVYGNPSYYQPGYAQPYAPSPVAPNSYNSGYQGYYGQPSAPYSYAPYSGSAPYSGYGYGNRGLNVTIPGAGNVRVP
jgi:hypothetical protein